MSKVKEEVEKKYRRYLSLSTRALKKARKCIVDKHKQDALALLNMAQDYINDAQYFWKNKKKLESIAALAYAHGWIDAASKLGFIDVNDDELFVLR